MRDFEVVRTPWLVSLLFSSGLLAVLCSSEPNLIFIPALQAHVRRVVALVIIFIVSFLRYIKGQAKLRWKVLRKREPLHTHATIASVVNFRRAEHDMDHTDQHQAEGVASGAKTSYEKVTVVIEDECLAGATVKDSDSTIGDLPPQLHGEILSYLDVTQEKAAGRVCPLWSDILTIPKTRGIIVNLALKEYSNIYARKELLSSIRERTTGIHLKYVAVTGKKDRYVDKPDCLKQIIDTLKGARRVTGMETTLILSNIIMLDTDLMQEACRCTLAKNLSAICCRVVFKHVSVVDVFGCLDWVWPFDTQRPDAVLYQNVQIPYAVLDVKRECNVIDIVEQAVGHYDFTRYPGTVHLLYVAAWIRFADRDCQWGGAAKKDYDGYEESDSDRTKILTILKNFQNDDVRLQPDFSWGNVKIARLDRNLLSLRKATLVALAYCVKRSRFYENKKKKYF